MKGINELFNLTTEPPCNYWEQAAVGDELDSLGVAYVQQSTIGSS